MPRKRRGERADGLIQVTYTDGLRPDGKPNRVSFYGKTRAEAEQKRKEYVDNRKLGVIIDKKLTVSEWIDKTIELYNVKTYLYSSYFRRIKELIGAMPVCNVQPVDIMVVLNSYKSNTIGVMRLVRNLLNTLFERAIANRIIAFNPMVSIVLPECVEQKSHRLLSEEEIKAIMASPRSNVSNGAKIMLLTGMRKSEMLALEWSDVDFDNNVIHIRRIISQVGGGEHVKYGSKTIAGVRDVPICKALRDVLDAMPHVHDRVVTNRSKRPYVASSFGQIFAKYGAKINPETPVRCHDLRHTYASLLYDAGVDIKSAQYLLGHANINITMSVYTHLSENKKSLSSAQINEHFDRMFGAVL